MQKIGMVATGGAWQGLSPFFLTLSLRGPCTHAGSSPEGDTALDEEHGHVSAAHQEQDAAEAQMDEANEDLHGLRGKRKAAQPAQHLTPLAISQFPYFSVCRRYLSALCP